MKISGAINEFLNPPDISQRRGKFQISSQMLEENFRAVVMILHNVVVIRAEHDLASQIIEYTALSPHFEPVSMFSNTPEYHAQLATVSGEIIEVTWIKAGLESDKPDFMIGKKEGSYVEEPGSNLSDLALMNKMADPAWMKASPGTKEFLDKFGDQIAHALSKGMTVTGVAPDVPPKEGGAEMTKLFPQGLDEPPSKENDDENLDHLAIQTTQGGGISYETIPLPASQSKPYTIGDPEKAVAPPPAPVTFVKVDEAFIGDGSEPTVGSGAVVGDDEIPF